MTQLAHVPLGRIHVHPSNPRFHVVADDDMVSSVVSIGILTPVTLAPDLGDPDGYVLIGGHRRIDAAQRAGLTVVPAVIREDLVTEAQQVEAMLVENLHRVDLTAVEEAAAYEQLTLFGMDPAAISHATGRKESTIRARMRLTVLPAGVKTKLHEGDATLGDAEALLEFTDHPDLLADLEAALGTVNYRWKVQHARDQLQRTADNKAQLEALVESGARLVERTGWARTSGQWPLYSFTEPALQDPAGHPECLGVVVDDASQFARVTTVCTDPDTHPWAADTAASTPTRPWPTPVVENETARTARLAEAAARDAAHKVRLEWLTQYWRSILSAAKTKNMVPGLRALLPVLVQQSDLEPVWGDYAAAVDLEPAVGWSDQLTQITAYANGVPDAAPGQVLNGLAALLAAWTARVLGDDDLLDDPDYIRHQAALWAWLEDEGYVLSDADTQLRAIITDAVAQAAATEEAS